MTLNKYFSSLRIRFNKYLEYYIKKKNYKTNNLAFAIRDINSQIYN